MIAEPLAAPGRAPADHHPTSRGLDGGMSAPLRTRIGKILADTPNRGTDTRMGLPEAAGFRVLVAFGLAGDLEVFGGTAVGVPAVAAGDPDASDDAGLAAASGWDGP
jgi:hypothetical protein